MGIVKLEIPKSELENLMHELIVIRGHVAADNVTCRTCRALYRMKKAIEESESKN